jgi:GNAT superfamily N-acetyltransferase
LDSRLTRQGGDAARPATETDLKALPALESAADEVFAAIGIAGLPPAASVEELRGSAAVLVVGEPPDGFARLEVVDGQAHLEQLSVHPDAMRRGHGRRLVDAAVTWAMDSGYASMTLITFRDVEWNAPFYAVCGFAPTGDLGPGLLAHRARERELGMDDLGTRIVMRRQLR